MKFPVDFFSAESLDNIFSSLGRWCQIKLKCSPTAISKRSTLDEQLYLEGWLFTVDPTNGNVVLVKDVSEEKPIEATEAEEVRATKFRVLFIAGDSIADLSVTDLLRALPAKTVDSMIRQWSGGNSANDILDLNSMRTKRERIIKMLETQNIPIHKPAHTDSIQDQNSEEATEERSLEPVYLLDDASLVIQPPYLTVELSSSATTNWKNGLTLKKVKAMLAGIQVS